MPARCDHAWLTLPDDAGVRHIVSLNPAAGRALIEFHDAFLVQI
jgi:hypothetical protein